MVDRVYRSIIARLRGSVPVRISFGSKRFSYNTSKRWLYKVAATTGLPLYHDVDASLAFTVPNRTLRRSPPKRQGVHSLLKLMRIARNKSKRPPNNAPTTTPERVRRHTMRVHRHVALTCSSTHTMDFHVMDVNHKGEEHRGERKVGTLQRLLFAAGRFFGGLFGGFLGGRRGLLFGARRFFGRGFFRA